MDVGIRGCEVL